MDDQAFKGRLLPGERVAWSGRPGQGVVFTGADILLVPFSLLWCGFAVFWTVMVARVGHGAAHFMVLWGLLFVCVGLYFVVGRFLLDAWVRRGTAYALTDRRILISRPKPFSDFTAVSLDRLPDARLKERQDGRGTIRFGQPSPIWGGRGFAAWSPAVDPTPQFLNIDGAPSAFVLEPPAFQIWFNEQRGGR